MSTQVTIVGNVTREVSLKFLPSGVGVAEFAVAVNERKQVDGQWVDGTTSYYEVKAWKQLGENCGESLNKGDQVVVVGRLSQEHWEKDGEKKSKWVIAADAVGASLQFGTTTFTKAGSYNRANSSGSEAF